MRLFTFGTGCLKGISVTRWGKMRVFLMGFMSLELAVTPVTAQLPTTLSFLQRGGLSFLVRLISGGHAAPKFS